MLKTARIAAIFGVPVADLIPRTALIVKPVKPVKSIDKADANQANPRPWPNRS